LSFQFEDVSPGNLKRLNPIKNFRTDASGQFSANRLKMRPFQIFPEIIIARRRDLP
jgi:hypothetical protein